MTEMGILQWYHIGDVETVERSITDLKELGVTHLRTGLSWADWHRKLDREGFDAQCAREITSGEEWYDWLMPKLMDEFTVLPCINYTPPSLGIAERTSSPPRDLQQYASFAEHVIKRYSFKEVELWNEPNNYAEWDRGIDPAFKLFSQMIIPAAQAARKHATTVLGGMAPIDLRWLRLMCAYGVVQEFDVIGIHGFPGTWQDEEQTWSTWPQAVEMVQEELGNHCDAKIWITETGASSLKGKYEQVFRFQALQHVPVERTYWYTLYDLPEHRPTLNKVVLNEVDNHSYAMGIVTADGTPKELYHHWRDFSTGKRSSSLENYINGLQVLQE